MFKTSDTEGCQPVLMLQPSELTFPRMRGPGRGLRQGRVSRGTSGLRRSALTHFDFGWHSPVGQRHLDAPPLKSAPANLQRPCSQRGAESGSRFTSGVFRSGMIGWLPRSPHSA
jgi:hypothetical protein